MPESWRLFVGIELDDAWTTLLDDTARGLRQRTGRSARWVRPELYHVTVVFLGDQPEDRVPDIVEALDTAAAAIEPFALRLAQLRRLGGHEQGALVAAVEDPSGRLQELRRSVDAAMREHGVAFDARPLVPHITLARPRRNAGPLDVPALSLAGAAPLVVQQIALVKSDLLPAGPRYTPVHGARLGE
jgi:2'-5' RNA ligase